MRRRTEPPRLVSVELSEGESTRLTTEQDLRDAHPPSEETEIKPEMKAFLDWLIESTIQEYRARNR